MENKEHEVSYIPVDLLIEIFSRVPAKSIARFRCVSRLWRSILRRQDFTDLFLTKSSSRPRLLFIFEVDKELFTFSSPQSQNPEANSCVVATRYNAPFPKYVPSEIYKKYNMVCGLVVRQHLFESKMPMICNYATGEFITLPNMKGTSNSEAKYIDKSYFGYDPIEKQYKVLYMNSSFNTHRILTLGNERRLWRRIKSEFQFCKNYNYRIHGQICINGVLYFGYVSQGSSMINCFDIRSEKFFIINMDTNMLMEIGQRSSTLINYRGKLGVLTEAYGFDLTQVCIWVLEDAQNHKWSKYVYKISPLLDQNLHIVGMTGAGEIVLSPIELSNPFYVLYYNLERNTITRVDVQGFEKFKHRGIKIHTFVDYVENIKLYTWMVFKQKSLSNPFYVFYYNFERKISARVIIRKVKEFNLKRGRTDTFLEYKLFQ